MVGILVRHDWGSFSIIFVKTQGQIIILKRLGVKIELFKIAKIDKSRVSLCCCWKEEKRIEEKRKKSEVEARILLS